MQRINKVVVAAFLFAIMVVAMAVSSYAISSREFTVDASSYPVTEVAFTAAEISGNVAIEQIWMAASSTATAQTVSVYENCAATTTITLVWRGYIPAGANVVPTIHLNYPLYNTPLYLTDPCFRKSDAASSVQFNVHYR